MDCDQIIQSAQNGMIWVDYLSALLVPAIAIMGSIIAFQQWRINSKRLKHELFDRRYEQFMAIKKFLASIIASGKSKPDEKTKFLIGKRGMRFIFDKEIAEYVDKTIWSLVLDLECLHSELDDLPVGEERLKNIEQQRKTKTQLEEEWKALEEKFAKYLQLRH